MRKFIVAVLLLFPLSLRAEMGIVEIDKLSIRESPNGKLIGNVLFNTCVPILASFSNWVKIDKGWVNADFLRIENSTSFEVVGKVRRKIALIDEEVVADTAKGTVTIPPNSYVMLGTEKNGKIYGMYKGMEVSVNASDVKVKEGVFDLVVMKKDISLVDSRLSPKEISRLSVGTPAIALGDGLLASNFRFGYVNSLESERNSFNKYSVLSTVNNFIEVFNSAKASGALANRMGYYCKTLKVDENDLCYVNLGSGRIGIYIDLKHQFFDLHGKPFNDRKARLILRLSNEAFWQKLSKLLLSRIPEAAFIQINIERFSGEGFEKLGFVAVGKSEFKKGICEVDPKVFVKRVEMDIKDDIWFFAEDVYREMEDNEH